MLVFTPVDPIRIKEALLLAGKRLPSGPRVFHKLRVLLEDPNSGIDVMVGLLRTDPGLSASVLRVANSPVYSRGQKVTSLDEAINRVGFREIYRMTGAAMMAGVLAGGLPLYRILGDELWMNSVTTALAASAMARRMGLEERMAYTVGLLRSVGRLALQACGTTVVPNGLTVPAVGGAAVLAWEKEHFYLHGGEMSAVLWQDWGFNKVECMAAREHLIHKPGTDSLTALLHLANYVAELLGKGLPCENGLWVADHDLLHRCDLDEESLGQIVVDTRAELNRVQNLFASVC